MMLAAGLFIAGVGSLALIIRELRKAPEGYEGERGFYTVHKGAVENRLLDTKIKKVHTTRRSLRWPAHRSPAHWSISFLAFRLFPVRPTPGC